MRADQNELESLIVSWQMNSLEISCLCSYSTLNKHLSTVIAIEADRTFFGMIIMFKTKIQCDPQITTISLEEHSFLNTHTQEYFYEHSGFCFVFVWASCFIICVLLLNRHNCKKILPNHCKEQNTSHTTIFSIGWSDASWNVWPGPF